MQVTKQQLTLGTERVTVRIPQAQADFAALELNNWDPKLINGQVVVVKEKTLASRSDAWVKMITNNFVRAA